MNNVTVETKGSLLVITIDASQDLGPSSSGKTRLVGSTQGNKAVQVAGRTVFLGVNAYTK